MQKSLSLIALFSVVSLLSSADMAAAYKKSSTQPSSTTILPAVTIGTGQQPAPVKKGFFREAGSWTWEKVRNIWEKMEKSTGNLYHRLFKHNERLDKHAQQNTMDELTIKDLKDAAADKNLKTGHTALKKIETAEKKTKEAKDSIKKAKDKYNKALGDAQDKAANSVKDVGRKMEDARKSIEQAHTEVKAA